MDTYYYDTGAAVAALFAFIAVAFIFAIAGYVLSSWFMMKVFEKAGVQGKWRAWIPVYNSMIFSKLGDLSPWLVLYAFGGAIVLSWIPVLNVFAGLLSLAGGVVLVLAAYRVGQKLQKEGAWVVLYIFLSIVWLGIMAFDKSRWNTQIAPAPWAANNFFGDRTVWEGIPAQSSAAAAPGYGAPQGYAAPQQPGYPQQPAQSGYPQQPAPGYQPPAAAPVTPPAAPGTPPAAPGTPPAAPAAPAVPPAPATPPTTPPPAAPPAPPAPPADPNQPPA